MAASGTGWSVGSLEEMGEGPGFRKVRRALGVTAFGVNAIVVPAGIETGFHFHDLQDELYFVHQGSIEMTFGDGAVETIGPGGIAHVDATTHRRIRNSGDGEAVLLIVGAKGGYVGRDAHVPDGDDRVRS